MVPISARTEAPRNFTSSAWVLSEPSTTSAMNAP